eukprot:714372-Lingulodinium_polyedra.AAC.2
MPPHELWSTGSASFLNDSRMIGHEQSSPSEVLMPLAARNRVCFSPPFPRILYQQRQKELLTEDTGPASSNSINGRCRRKSAGVLPRRYGWSSLNSDAIGLSRKASQKACTASGFPPSHDSKASGGSTHSIELSSTRTAWGIPMSGTSDSISRSEFPRLALPRARRRTMGWAAARPVSSKALYASLITSAAVREPQAQEVSHPRTCSGRDATASCCGAGRGLLERAAA